MLGLVRLELWLVGKYELRVLLLRPGILSWLWLFEQLVVDAMLALPLDAGADQKVVL